MRVTCLIDHIGPGGAQRQLCTIASLIKKRGLDVRVLTYHRNEFFLPMLQAAGVDYTCLDTGSKMRDRLAVVRELRRNQQDVVLAFLDNCCLYAELAALGKRRWGLVVSERNASPEEGGSALRFRRHLHRIADRVTTNSHTNRLMLERCVPSLSSRITTIYNALDLAEFSPDFSVKPPGDGIHLLMIGRHTLQKNGVMLAAAVAKVREARPDLNVTLDWYGMDPFASRGSGDTPYAALRASVEQHKLSDAFRLHPPTRDVCSLYRHTDTLILASLFEGLPNVVCEAMGCGRPVLLSAVCDAGNLVADGRNGYTFDPTSPDDISRSVIQFAERSQEEREAMGRESRLMAEQTFSPDRCVDKYIDVITAAANRSSTVVQHSPASVPGTVWNSIDAA